MTREYRETERSKPLKVCVVYRVLQGWRVPVFERIGQRFELTVLHGRDVPGTKLVNANIATSFTEKALPTWALRIRTSGRQVPLVLFPTLTRELWRVRPDVIVAEGASNILNNLLVYTYGALTGCPIVWWTLGEIPGRTYSRAGKIYRVLVRHLERRSTALLGYSTVAQQYFRRQGYAMDRVFVAVNVVDTERIGRRRDSDRARAVSMRNRLGLKHRDVVLYVGALTEGKRANVLIDAFDDVIRDIPSAHLVIVGDGPLRGELEQQASACNLSECVTFVGEDRDGAGAYFELAAVTVVPGLGGLVISESMAHGVPVICTQGDGCEVDLIEDHVSGRRLGYIESDADLSVALSVAIRETLGDEDAREAMGRLAERAVMHDYSVDSYADGVAAAIEYAARHRANG